MSIKARSWYEALSEGVSAIDYPLGRGITYYLLLFTLYSLLVNFPNP